MNWFFLALISTLGWGTADLFYKKGTDPEDKLSHLKIAVWVGMIMGLGALVLLAFPFEKTFSDFPTFIIDLAKYSPASLFYILSMVIGYAGLRYIELSIVSPVQNASGGLAALFMIVFFALTGNAEELAEGFSVLDYIGTALSVAGVIALAVVEQKLSRKEIIETVGKEDQTDRKYRFGALALIFPLLYCLFDSLGTAADGIILNEETGLGINEIDALILYGITFFVAGVAAWIVILIKNKKVYNPFSLSEKNKGFAALAEEFGQIFYVYAMASQPVLAAPMIASYCIVSVILSRIFLKEKLTLGQYLCIFTVIAGIVLLGISEGLGEM